MADEIDLANEQAELFLRQSLAANKAAATQRAGQRPPRGSCYFCEAVFEAVSKDAEGKDLDERGIRIEDMRYCDKFCAEEDDRRTKLANRR